MDPSDDLRAILNEDIEKLPTVLDSYVKTQEGKFSFPELDSNDYRKKLWLSLYNMVANPKLAEFHPQLITLARILSREKKMLCDLVSEDWIDLLITRAYLKDLESSEALKGELVKRTAIEALKCMCNVIYNCNAVVKVCSKNGLVEAIVQRIKDYMDHHSFLEIKYFDMKILFLITALCRESRNHLGENLDGLTILLQTLKDLLKEVSKVAIDSSKNLTKLSLTDLQVDFCCELLKVLFNITLNDAPADDFQDDLVTTLRHYLLLPVMNETKKYELHGHIVNLLTNMPVKAINKLITPVEDKSKVSKFSYNGQNMLAVQELVYYLEDRFVSKQPTIATQSDTLLPILSLLLKCSQSNRNIRHYLKLQILPPLKDIHSRPEQGNTLRNHLCRLLTTPITEVRDFAAEMLFTLCKEDVGRMIKYTGYGNAAGLLANRGLLGGRNRNSEETAYSSDSEDSDTEEYKEFKHAINPVMGCYEAPHPNPMENMTEEQKEYEAMKLVNLIDNLMKHGIMQPCKVGESGKPEPIEHVVQLQEMMKQQLGLNDDDESE